MKKHYETHVEDTDKLISVAGPVLDYKSWYEQYRKLMEEQAQRKYGLYTPTSEGDDDDFPSIPGMIARYSALGLTNEQMAENPVWKDLTGNGHDLQMKNFAWKGMSGVGGYGDENHQTFYKFTLDDYVFIATPPGVKHMNFTFRVTGLQPGNKLTLAFLGTTNTVYGTWDKDGIYTVDADIVEAGKPTYFYNGYGATRGEFTIEILPLYPGFILGDGVDDFAVTEKELNFEDTYTVYTAFIPFQDDPARTMSLCGKNRLKDFYMYYPNLDSVGFFSVDKSVSTLLSNGFNLIVCKKTSDKMLIKNLITGKVAEVSVDDLIYNPGLYYLWRSATIANYSKTAIAGQTICNGYFSTDEDDEKVFDWYKKQYPWLFPDQAWTVTGKTNEDEDRATIANITGNGNDLVCLNLGFIEGSGYNEEGEYAGYLVTDGVDDKITSSAFEMGKDFTVVGEWRFIIDERKVAGLITPPSFYLFNENNGLKLFINNTEKSSSLNTKSLKAICSDGRVYFDDWSEMLLSEEQPITSSSKDLSIGYNSTIYTQMAFKNLGIYNDQLLSKDDCIKAYNYLQTLKAKQH